MTDKPKEDEMQNLADALDEELGKADQPFRDASSASPAQRDDQSRAIPRFRPAEVQGRPAQSADDDQVAALFRARDHLLRQRRERLAQMEFEHHQKIRNLQIEHEKAVAPLKAEIAVLAGRMGFEP